MSLLITNIISVIMFALIVLMALIMDSSMLWLAGLLGAVWLGFTLVSNYNLLFKSKQNQILLKDSDKHGYFKKYTERIQNQYDSVASREDFFKKQDASLQELYDKIVEQMQSNIDSAVGYMESYDYVTKPAPNYLRNLCNQGDDLVKKFNSLVEQIVDIDTNLTTLDTSYIDDVIGCLNELSITNSNSAYSDANYDTLGSNSSYDTSKGGNETWEKEKKARLR